MRDPSHRCIGWTRWIIIKIFYFASLPLASFPSSFSSLCVLPSSLHLFFMTQLSLLTLPLTLFKTLKRPVLDSPTSSLPLLKLYLLHRHPLLLISPFIQSIPCFLVVLIVAFSPLRSLSPFPHSSICFLSPSVTSIDAMTF